MCLEQSLAPDRPSVDIGRNLFSHGIWQILRGSQLMSSLLFSFLWSIQTGEYTFSFVYDPVCNTFPSVVLMIKIKGNYWTPLGRSCWAVGVRVGKCCVPGWRGCKGWAHEGGCGLLLQHRTRVLGVPRRDPRWRGLAELEEFQPFKMALEDTPLAVGVQSSKAVGCHRILGTRAGMSRWGGEAWGKAERFWMTENKTKIVGFAP